ncbi:Hypothetical predicted protein [Olea europaea subsp. europaea]|uniref:Uncharacterized protein n=1 Tax=Olea europaea subsp. europaea TaxID=158383 RepID=A0A8S0RM31_OLEEU|nr:Hypothetical predicted protein [Olea europaea subsp. europaea]
MLHSQSPYSVEVPLDRAYAKALTKVYATVLKDEAEVLIDEEVAISDDLANIFMKD